MDNEFDSPESSVSPEGSVDPGTTVPEGSDLSMPNDESDLRGVGDGASVAAAHDQQMPGPAGPAAIAAGWDPEPPRSGWNPYHSAQSPTPPAGTPAWEQTTPMPPAGTPAWEQTTPMPATPTGTEGWQSRPGSPAWGGTPWQPTTPMPAVPPAPGWGWPEQRPPSWVPTPSGSGQSLEAGAFAFGSGEPPAGGGPFFLGADEPSEHPRRLRRAVLAGLGVVLLLAAIAGGIAIGRSSNRTPSQTTASETIPSPSKSSNPGTSAKINVAAIAAKLDPALVDVTSVLGGSGTGEEDAGTGMILTPNGEVLTNNHVIADGTSITAQINGGGRTYKVLVLGADPTQDVALVQLVGASGLPTVSIGNSSDVQIGDAVVAIGNALDLKGPETVTQGIVSALNRSISASDSGTGATESLNGLIQTDAPINPGNSGGPLVDASGQVIGMDTAAASGSSTQSATNIGFAIPIDEAIQIAQEIQQGKGSSTILINNKGFIGVQVISIAEAESQANGYYGQFPTPGTRSGAYVAGVLQGTPAVQAGIQVGDVVTAVNGSPVSSPTALGTILSNDRPGQSVSVTWVTPAGVHQTASITLVARPVA
ncbi:MAG: trypsin-like peptidase domain-containing protein [Acidimicrobiales bacterium]|jgi:S1-C subfamily serine protease